MQEEYYMLVVIRLSLLASSFRPLFHYVAKSAQRQDQQRANFFDPYRVQAEQERQSSSTPTRSNFPCKDSYDWSSSEPFRREDAAYLGRSKVGQKPGKISSRMGLPRFNNVGLEIILDERSPRAPGTHDHNIRSALYEPDTSGANLFSILGRDIYTELNKMVTLKPQICVRDICLEGVFELQVPTMLMIEKSSAETNPRSNFMQAGGILLVRQGSCSAKSLVPTFYLL
ncbi:hypothetical protein F5877DRAFT_72195 [Lentinula edodes]|nr:hypothetical protein F5877DRAFT_72195 [Lentinula edodes]